MDSEKAENSGLSNDLPPENLLRVIGLKLLLLLDSQNGNFGPLNSYHSSQDCFKDNLLPATLWEFTFSVEYTTITIVSVHLWQAGL